MGKSKSRFDLNHDWITGDDLIWVQKIWFRNMWFYLDLISFYVIWFGDLNKSQLSVIWAKEWWLLCWCFYSNWVELLILVIVPSLIFAETLTVRPDAHWWHFAHRLQILELLSFGWHRDLIWFVIWHNDFFTLSSTGLRGHELKLYKPQAHLDIRMNFLTVRVIDEWDRLPETVLHCNTLSTFEKKPWLLFKESRIWLSSWASFLLWATFRGDLLSWVELS